MVKACVFRLRLLGGSSSAFCHRIMVFQANSLLSPKQNQRAKNQRPLLTLFSVDIGILGLSTMMIVMSSSTPNNRRSDKRPGRLLSPQRGGGGPGRREDGPVHFEGFLESGMSADRLAQMLGGGSSNQCSLVDINLVRHWTRTAASLSFSLRFALTRFFRFKANAKCPAGESAKLARQLLRQSKRVYQLRHDMGEPTLPDLKKVSRTC